MREPDDDLPTFTFDIIGDGQKVFVGTFEATDLEHAAKAARRQCKTFTLPGWRLHCREADKDFAVVQFIHPDGSKEFV